MPSVISAGVDIAAGRIAAAAVTATFATLISASASVRKIYIFNSLDAETIVSLDNGTTVWGYLPAGHDVDIDLASDLHWAGIIQIKHNNVAIPASGFISASVVRGA